MAWFLKYYRHPECGVAWTDFWSCACNDRCPACDAEIEPYDWDDLSIIAKETANGSGWVVSVSSPDAEQSPEYLDSYFARKEDAEEFTLREAQRLERRWEANVDQTAPS